MQNERRYGVALHHRDKSQTLLAFDLDLETAQETRAALHAAGSNAFIKRHEPEVPPLLPDGVIRELLQSIMCSVCGHPAGSHPARGYHQNGHCIECYAREDYWDGEHELTLPSCTLALFDVLLAHLANVGKATFTVIAKTIDGRRLYVGPSFSGSEYPIALERECAETIAAQIPTAVVASYTVEAVPRRIRNTVEREHNESPAVERPHKTS